MEEILQTFELRKQQAVGSVASSAFDWLFKICACALGKNNRI